MHLSKIFMALTLGWSTVYGSCELYTLNFGDHKKLIDNIVEFKKYRIDDFSNISKVKDQIDNFLKMSKAFKTYTVPGFVLDKKIPNDFYSFLKATKNGTALFEFSAESLKNFIFDTKKFGAEEVEKFYSFYTSYTKSFSSSNDLKLKDFDEKFGLTPIPETVTQEFSFWTQKDFDRLTEDLEVLRKFLKIQSIPSKLPEPGKAQNLLGILKAANTFSKEFYTLPFLSPEEAVFILQKSWKDASDIKPEEERKTERFLQVFFQSAQNLSEAAIEKKYSLTHGQNFLVPFSEKLEIILKYLSQEKTARFQDLYELQTVFLEQNDFQKNLVDKKDVVSLMLAITEEDFELWLNKKEINKSSASEDLRTLINSVNVKSFLKNAEELKITVNLPFLKKIKAFQELLAIKNYEENISVNSDDEKQPNLGIIGYLKDIKVMLEEIRNSQKPKQSTFKNNKNQVNFLEYKQDLTNRRNSLSGLNDEESLREKELIDQELKKLEDEQSRMKNEKCETEQQIEEILKKVQELKYKNHELEQKLENNQQIIAKRKSGVFNTQNNSGVFDTQNNSGEKKN